MKEIIYLDTDIMNSMLAQLDEGLINSFVLESSEQEGVSETAATSLTKKAGLKAGGKLSTGLFPGGELSFGANIGNDNGETESTSKTMLEGQKDILNKAFHDYALEVLIQKLKENELLLGDPKQLEEGDLFFYESPYRFYDFDLLKSSLNIEAFKKMMLFEIQHIPLNYEEAKKLLDKKKPTPKDREKMDDALKVVLTYDQVNPTIQVIEQLNTLSGFGSDLLKNLTLIKAGKYIGLLKKDYLRESTESLSFRTEKIRKANILFRVIGKKNKVNDGTNIGAFSETDIDIIPNMMLDIILGSFNIIKVGDVMITPIAIYYE